MPKEIILCKSGWKPYSAERLASIYRHGLLGILYWYSNADDACAWAVILGVDKTCMVQSDLCVQLQSEGAHGQQLVRELESG
jgi:hypothetical protein